MPAPYAAAMLSFVLLLFLAWRINNMEIKIHNFSLRDELTGLYNLRGFHLLAEQSLRLAYRNQLPFSVLFIDLDNLKQINDSLGHSTGSAFLAETGVILRGAFRETDVLGRIGGDEFAVAGQFGQMAISLAAQRLRKTTVQRKMAKANPWMNCWPKPTRQCTRKNAKRKQHCQAACEQAERMQRSACLGRARQTGCGKRRNNTRIFLMGQSLR
jgi:diguanylate cyclase (GGDEF)-like protein